MADSVIEVAIRVRPPLPDEIVFDEKSLMIKEGTHISIRNNVFTFDKVFDPTVSNDDLYKQLVSEKIKLLFQGFNVTVLAYGCTGSGKTFTMGTALKDPIAALSGLIPLSIKDIFEQIHAVSEETKVDVKVSFFEIYMESVKDLLKSQSDFVPGDSKEARVSNMSQKTVINFSETIQVLRKGCLKRSTAVTLKNPCSSRSHAFFIISLNMRDKKTGKSKFSKFQLVDLAGSERAGTDTSGKEFRQGVHINKGLSALGRVISSLSKKEKHIPYRDALLTRYLQDSFGGNCHTVMVTCLSPAVANIEETISSLRYSSFAKSIKNKIFVNKSTCDIIESLKEEINKLKKYGNTEERETLTNRINYLADCLNKKDFTLKKMISKISDVYASVQSLEDKMVSETEPALEVCLEIVRNMKTDLNNFVFEQALFGTALDSNTSYSCEEMVSAVDTSSTLKDIKIIRTTQSTIEAVDDVSKIPLIEMEIRTRETLKVLYDGLTCEDTHREATSKLESLLNEREELLKKFSKMDCGAENVRNDIKSLEKDIDTCHHKAICCVAAIKKKNDNFNCLKDLKQKLAELKQRQQSLKEKTNEEPATSNDTEQLSISEEAGLIKLEKKAQKMDAMIEWNFTENYKLCPSLTDTDVTKLKSCEETICFLENSLCANVQLNVCALELSCFANIVRESKQSILKEIQNKPGDVGNVSTNTLEMAYNERITKWQNRLQLFRETLCPDTKNVEFETAKYLLNYLFMKQATIEFDNIMFSSRLSDARSEGNGSSRVKEIEVYELELNKVKNEKFIMDFLHQKQLFDLNTEWEIKLFVLLKNVCKDSEVLKSTPPNLFLEKLSYNEIRMEKIKDRFSEWSSLTQSFEEKMSVLENKIVPDTFEKPVLEMYIKIMRNVNKDLNSFVLEQALVGSLLCEDNSSLKTPPNTSSLIELKKTIRTPDFANVDIEDFNQLPLTEMEYRSVEVLKVLYDFLQCDEELKNINGKLQSLKIERDKLVKKSPEKKTRSDEMNNKIQSLKKDISVYQQKQKFCSLVIKNKNTILNQYNCLMQRLEQQKKDLKKKSHEKSETLANEAKQSKSKKEKERIPLEQEATNLDKLIEECKIFSIMPIEKIKKLDIDANSLAYISDCIRVETHSKFCEYRIKKFREKLSVTTEYKESILNEPAGTGESTSKESNVDYESKISNWQHNLKQFRQRCCYNFDHLTDSAVEFILGHLFTMDSGVFIKHHDMFMVVERQKEMNQNINPAHRIKLYELELNKLRSELALMDFSHKKQIMDLNSKRESEIVDILKHATNINKVLSMSPFPMDGTALLKTMQTGNDTKYEEKCQENEELKKKLLQLEKKVEELQHLDFKLPSLTKPPKKKRSEPHDSQSSMVEVFLSDEDVSFTEGSEIRDPDYRGTPMYKRKAKRKSPEESELLACPKPSKHLSFSGCACPGDCGTMRCSCRKKNKECDEHCDCSKDNCRNISSSSQSF